MNRIDLPPYPYPDAMREIDDIMDRLRLRAVTAPLRKPRTPPPNGHHSPGPQGKLTPRQRKTIAKSTRPARVVAAQYGISVKHVHALKKRYN